MIFISIDEKGVCVCVYVGVCGEVLLPRIIRERRRWWWCVHWQFILLILGMGNGYFDVRRWDIERFISSYVLCGLVAMLDWWSLFFDETCWWKWWWGVEAMRTVLIRSIKNKVEIKWWDVSDRREKRQRKWEILIWTFLCPQNERFCVRYGKISVGIEYSNKSQSGGNTKSEQSNRYCRVNNFNHKMLLQVRCKMEFFRNQQVCGIINHLVRLADLV